MIGDVVNGGRSRAECNKTVWEWCCVWLGRNELQFFYSVQVQTHCVCRWSLKHVSNWCAVQ